MPTGTITSIKNWSYLEEHRKLSEEIQQAVMEVFASGHLILGPQVSAFEAEFARYCGRTYGTGVNSGTDALFLALKAIGVGHGDEVATVSFTAVPTVAAIRATGAIPRFVDIEEETCLMDVSLLESVLTPKTKAILPVHLYGQAVEMDPLLHLARTRGLRVVEDCAQSHGCAYRGRKTGSLGAIGAFSFYPTKILGAYGDGGMCLTDSPELDERLKQLRKYGMKQEYYSYREGYNSRLDEIQAAILRVKLPHLEDSIARRQQIARRYDQALGPLIKTPAVQADSTHSYYLYVVRHPDRERIVQALQQRGIEVGIHFPYPVHRMEAYRFLGYPPGSLPVTERMAREVFSLPLYPGMSEAQIDAVILALKEILI